MNKLITDTNKPNSNLRLQTRYKMKADEWQLEKMRYTGLKGWGEYIIK
jgi:hypothetical protein